MFDLFFVIDTTGWQVGIEVDGVVENFRSYVNTILGGLDCVKEFDTCCLCCDVAGDACSLLEC